MQNAEVKIPVHWIGPNPGKTQTQLNTDRRAEFIPHPSYDLDYNGIVGGRELLIAKIFDKDKDGILDAKERAAALDAIKNGFEQKFMWGVENSGPNRSYRVLQKRGKICDADDFSKVTETYPAHPTSSVKPMHKTLTEMNELRQVKNREKLEKDKINWDEKHPSSVTRPFILNEFLVANPKHTTFSQIKDELKVAARAKANLNKVADFSVSDKPAPSLQYIETPVAVSKSHLDEVRKNSNLTDLRKLEAKTGTTEIGIDRLHKKEECIFRYGYVNNRKTNDMIVEKRKREILENNMRVFGNVSIGIHGKELPKFRQNMTEWWKVRDVYNDQPKESSLVRLKQNTKYWAKTEDMILADVQNNQPPPDVFKQTYVKKQTKDQVAENPNKLNRVKNKSSDTFGAMSQRPKLDYKWTTIENQFAQRSNKFTADVDKARAERSDYEPLYSSFHPSGTFIPPPSTYDNLMSLKDNKQKIALTESVLTKSKGGRAATAFPGESSLMGTGNNSINLFNRVGTVDGSPIKIRSKCFKNSAEKGIRSSAFKQL